MIATCALTPHFTFAPCSLSTGANYEDFRIRKNYSRLPPKEAEDRHRQLLETDHLEELGQLLSLNAEEVTDCIHFMINDWYNPNRQYPVSVAIRALLALMLLKKRIGQLMEEMPPDDLRRGSRTATNNNEKGPRTKLELEYQNAQKLMQCLYKFWNCCYSLKETLLSDKVYASSLEFILGPDDFAHMPPEVLESKIMGI